MLNKEKKKIVTVKDKSPVKLVSKASVSEKLDREAGDVENAIRRSFGKVTVEYRRRLKASSNLLAAASHWADGDSKRLVLSLANRYGKTHKINFHTVPKTKVLLASSRSNSICHSSKLSDLDWQRGWWTDDSFGMHYLHVYHKDGETIHRVYCKKCDQPRIQVLNQKVYWLISC